MPVGWSSLLLESGVHRNAALAVVRDINGPPITQLPICSDPQKKKAKKKKKRKLGMDHFLGPIDMWSSSGPPDPNRAFEHLNNMYIYNKIFIIAIIFYKNILITKNNTGRQ